MQELSLGLSPCPNDTFIFYPILNNLVPFPVKIKPHFRDVEELNRKTINGELDLCKISIHAYAKVNATYYLLHSGGAMGHSCGPLLLKPQKSPLKLENVPLSTILVPGLLTTAVLYLYLAFPDLLLTDSHGKKAGNLIPMLFSDIMSNLSKGKADAGLIIHESRFTYPQFGLESMLDLGNWWENETGLPIPLGGIAASRSLAPGLIKEIDIALSASIDYSWKNREAALRFCKIYAQEMSDDVLWQHIHLYVNDFSRNLGDKGIGAIQALFTMAQKNGLIQEEPKDIFVR
jgi:1,4-dihydroxy-6-naphthoate synthase